MASKAAGNGEKGGNVKQEVVAPGKVHKPAVEEELSQPAPARMPVARIAGGLGSCSGL